MVEKNGERGATGDRGVAGERGPKGDHGQHGDRGPRGPVNRLAFVGYLILVAAIVAAFYTTWHHSRDIEAARIERINQLNMINRAQCSSLQNLYIVIRKSIADGDRAIDELDYYREHPEEAARVHARNRETMALFETPPCPADLVVVTKE